MRPLLKSAYYISLLCWILVTVVTSEDAECIVHQRDEEFNATIVTIPPISLDNEVKIKITGESNDQGIELNFDQNTKEWFYLDWNHKRISTKYKPESSKKTFKVTEGQASGNCVSGKFTWKITTNTEKAKLYNVDKLQILKINILRDSEISFLDDGTQYYMCHDPMHENGVHVNNGEKCLEGIEKKGLLKLNQDYTLQFLPISRELTNISATGRNTFAIRGKSLIYTIVFDPTPVIENSEEPLGYITEETTSYMGDRTTTVTPGNVSIIVLGLLVAILLIALILTCLFFKKRQMGDKLHPMSDSHTNGNAGDAVKGNTDCNAMEEMRENNATAKTQFNRISQMPTTLEEDNDIYDSAENVLDR